MHDGICRGIHSHVNYILSILSGDRDIERIVASRSGCALSVLVNDLIGYWYDVEPNTVYDEAIWIEVANRLASDYYFDHIYEPPGPSIPEWDPDFDSNKQ